jgi:hypothetical protein
MLQQQENSRVDDDKLWVVAASSAWPFYRLTGAYVCQENRHYQKDSGRMGFYSSRLIHGAAPRILEVHPSVELGDVTAAALAMDAHPSFRRLGEVLDACMENGWSAHTVQVVLLTPFDHPDTAHFDPVRHEGKTAWTMNQRYASLKAVRSALTTDELAPLDEGAAT